MRWLVWAVLVLASLPAQAERYAILVGNNQGRALETPLRYAESDARRLAAVLNELGGFPPKNTRVLASPSAKEIEAAFAATERAIADAMDPNALVVFFYSGHADGASLHLGDSTLSLERLRDVLASSKATVRIGLLDACGTGALTMREKGITKGEPFLVSAPAELVTHGQVIIAAVSASESAQESDAIKGSFFTNYFIAGLRGAADRNGHGRITLDDAYRYAYAQTVRATMLSRAGAQHPSYDMNLSGQGDLVLTELQNGRARLLFASDTAGEFVVFNRAQEVVAQIGVAAAQSTKLALLPGEYEIHKRTPRGLRLAKVQIIEGTERELRESRMPEIEYVRLAKKGVTPRVNIGGGYSFGLLANPSGAFLLRGSVDLAARRWVLSPRVTWANVGWSGLAPVGGLVVENAYLVGLRAAYPWEWGRVSLSLGASIDVGVITQSSLGRQSTVVVGVASATADLSVRLFRGLSLVSGVEVGASIAPYPGGPLVRGNFVGILGGRYDL